MRKDSRLKAQGWLVSLSLVITLSSCAGSRQAMRPRRAPEAKLEAVQFRFAQWSVAPDQLMILEKNAEILKSHDDVRIMLTGHTDSAGPEGYNLYLGDRRARSVMSRLQGLGIDPRRVTVISRGEAEPVSSNATHEGRERNRRVEFSLR